MEATLIIIESPINNLGNGSQLFIIAANADCNFDNLQGIEKCINTENTPHYKEIFLMF